MIKHAVKWNSLSSIYVAALQSLQLLLVGWILPASALGMLAIAQLFTGLGYLFMDGGLSNLLVQRKSISQEQRSTLLYVSLVLSFLIFILVFSSKGWVSEYYGDPELSHVLGALSYVFFLAPFSQICSASAQRALRLKLVAIAEMVSITLSVSTVVTLAFTGFGIFSVVVGVFVAFSFRIIVLVRYMPKVFFLRRFDWKFLWESLYFGGYQVGERLVNLLATQVDVIIIGKVFGVEALGVYSLAKNISMKGGQFFFSVISRTMFPVLSRIERKEDRVSFYYTSLYRFLLVAALVFFFSAAVVYALEIYGGWDRKICEVLELLPYFFVLSFSYVGNYVASSMLLSLALVRRLLGLNFMVLLVNALVVVLAAGLGLEKMVIAMAVFSGVGVSLIYQFAVAGLTAQFRKSALILALCAGGVASIPILLSSKV